MEKKIINLYIIKLDKIELFYISKKYEDCYGNKNKKQDIIYLQNLIARDFIEYCDRNAYFVKSC